MTHYSIDTSAWVAFFRGRPNKATQRVASLLADNDALIGIDGVVLAELIQGIKGQTEKRQVAQILDQLKIFPLSREIFELAGNLNSDLRQRGITVPITDAIIAATAINYQTIIVTLDDHFKYFRQAKVKLIN